MSCCAGIPLPTGQAVGGGPANGPGFKVRRERDPAYRAAAARDNKRRLKLWGGRISITYEMLAYGYVALLLLGLARQQGWI